MFISFVQVLYISLRREKEVKSLVENRKLLFNEGEDK